MTRMLARSLQIAPALLLIGASAGSFESPRKCGSLPPGGRPILAVDGTIMNVDPMVDLVVDPDNVLEVHVVCMNPRDSTFNRKTGIPVISLWTKQGPVPHLEPTLEAVLEAQDEQFSRNASYVSSTDATALPARPEQVRMTLEGSEKGWIAAVTIDRYMSTCYVFDGAVRPPYPHLEPRRPSCVEQ